MVASLHRDAWKGSAGSESRAVNETPGGSNTGFIRPLPSCRITLFGLCTFGFMDDKGEQPWCSRRKIASACLSSPLALIEQDPGTAAIRSSERTH